MPEMALCSVCKTEQKLTPKAGNVVKHRDPMGTDGKYAIPVCKGSGKTPQLYRDAICDACGQRVMAMINGILSKHYVDGEQCVSSLKEAAHTLIETLGAVEIGTPSALAEAKTAENAPSSTSSASTSPTSSPSAEAASASRMLNPERPTETLEKKSARLTSSSEAVSALGSTVTSAAASAPAPNAPISPAGARAAAPGAAASPPSSDAMFGEAGVTVRAKPRKRVPLEGRAEALASQMKEVWWAAQSRSERALQTTIGPSEVGEECMRRLAMKLSGLGQVNHEGDPWAAWVGTAMHSAYEIMFAEASGTSGRWMTETSVEIGSTVVPKGTADLFDRHLHRVIDHKNFGKSTLSKTWLDGPSEKYKVQLQVYGYGLEQMGENVQEVALVGWPREGNSLDELYAWVDDYRPEVAIAALRRIESIAKRIIELGEGGWRRAPKSVSFGCKFCPFYLPGDKAEAKGCSA